MKRVMRLGLLVLTMCFIGYGQAEAGLWDWVDALDGPGPSHGKWNIMVNLVCSNAGAQENASLSAKLEAGFLRIPTEPARGTCLFFDHRAFHADEDERFYPVDISITEFGPSVRLHRTFEVGAGIGWMHFSSRYPGDTSDLTGTHLTVSFPRLVFKPLSALPFKPFTNDRRGVWGFFQMYFRETIVYGTVSDEDFASKPGVDFARDDQRITSMGFIIDVTTLLCGIKADRFCGS
jgi:hypothetical protein